MAKIIIDFDDKDLDLQIEGEADGLRVLAVIHSVASRILEAIADHKEDGQEKKADV